MYENDKERFVGALVALSDLYDKTLSETVIGLYWEALKEADFDEFCVAVGDHVGDPDRGRFMPRPADIIYQLKLKRFPDRLAGWEKALDWARHNIEPRDPTVLMAVSALGGIRRIKWTPDSALGALQREFMEVYNPSWRKDPWPASKPDSTRLCSESRDGSAQAAITSTGRASKPARSAKDD